ncbi:MAG: tRNA uridine-5-carboxymethylaminomethyl(34) synthesis GTPase MnmE [Allopontixanthobacter sediminis]
MMETIFALSSGSAPAGIAVIRISGPRAAAALDSLAGKIPPSRRAVARSLKDSGGGILDHAMVLFLPGPNNATGEDTAELHLHGGRAVIAAVESALAAMDGLRHAEPGEFTRRAFVNGRLDLAESEGLADLLEAETELQRRSAIAMLGGGLSRVVEGWRSEVLILSAQVEAVLDFSDEEDAADLPSSFEGGLDVLRAGIGDWLARPRARALKEGFRVVLAGPPNSGKSTLFNALVEDEAAITAPTAGTTRDILQRSCAIAGIPFTFIDTAGLHESSVDPIEIIGIERAHSALNQADLVLWLGNEGEGPTGAWEIESKIDCSASGGKSSPLLRVSAVTGEGVDELRHRLTAHAAIALPKMGQVALSDRQHNLLTEALNNLNEICPSGDLLLTGENLRSARAAFDRLIGRSATEDMLDTLFGRFCIGK